MSAGPARRAADPDVDPAVESPAEVSVLADDDSEGGAGPEWADGGASGLAAVLFDMDGLLVDSEPQWESVEEEVFRRLGGRRPWTPDDARALVGHELETSAEMLIEAAGATSVHPHQVVQWFLDEMAVRLATGPVWKPGAVELMTALADAGVPTGMVTMSYRRLADAVLAAAPDGALAVSVAGDEVTHGKPHPEPYLRACSLLDVPPQQAVALEDSPTGARAAHAAGCVVIQVPDLVGVPAGAPWQAVRSLRDVDVAALRALIP